MPPPPHGRSAGSDSQHLLATLYVTWSNSKDWIAVNPRCIPGTHNPRQLKTNIFRQAAYFSRSQSNNPTVLAHEIATNAGKEVRNDDVKSERRFRRT